MYRLVTKTFTVIIFLISFEINAQNSSLIFVDQSKSSPFSSELKKEIENRTRWFLDVRNDSPKAILGNINGHLIYGNTLGGGTWFSGANFSCKVLEEDATAIEKATYNNCKNKAVNQVIEKMQTVLKAGTENETDIWGAIKLIGQAQSKNNLIISDMIHCTKKQCIANLKTEQEARKKGEIDVDVFLTNYNFDRNGLSNAKIWIYYPAELLAQNKKNIMEEYWKSFIWKLNNTIILSFLK